MNDYLTLTALVGLGGLALATITFWVNQTNRIAESLAEAKGAKEDAAEARAAAERAISSALLAMAQIADTKLGVSNEFRVFAEKYVLHKDLGAVEERMSQVLEAMKTEIHGTNLRLDRMFEHMVNNQQCSNFTPSPSRK